MFLPFSLKVGHIALDITNYPEREDKKMTGSYSQDIARNWEDVKEIVDGHVAKLQSQQGSDPVSLDPKMKLIKEVLHCMCDPRINEKNIIEELLKTGKFTEEEARLYLRGYIAR
jgi:hypothetical protein